MSKKTPTPFGCGHACYEIGCMQCSAHLLAVNDAIERCATVDLRTSGVRGCADHSCIVHKVSGIGTNGGCRCSGSKVRRAFAVACRTLKEKP